MYSLELMPSAAMESISKAIPTTSPLGQKRGADSTMPRLQRRRKPSTGGSCGKTRISKCVPKRVVKHTIKKRRFIESTDGTRSHSKEKRLKTDADNIERVTVKAKEVIEPITSAHLQQDNLQGHATLPLLSANDDTTRNVRSTSPTTSGPPPTLIRQQRAHTESPDDKHPTSDNRTDNASYQKPTADTVVCGNETTISHKTESSVSEYIAYPHQDDNFNVIAIDKYKVFMCKNMSIKRFMVESGFDSSQICGFDKRNMKRYIKTDKLMYNLSMFNTANPEDASDSKRIVLDITRPEKQLYSSENICVSDVFNMAGRMCSRSYNNNSYPFTFIVCSPTLSTCNVNEIFSQGVFLTCVIRGNSIFGPISIKETLCNHFFVTSLIRNTKDNNNGSIQIFTECNSNKSPSRCEEESSLRSYKITAVYSRSYAIYPVGWKQHATVTNNKREYELTTRDIDKCDTSTEGTIDCLVLFKPVSVDHINKHLRVMEECRIQVSDKTVV